MKSSEGSSPANKFSSTLNTPLTNTSITEASTEASSPHVVIPSSKANPGNDKSLGDAASSLPMETPSISAPKVKKDSRSTPTVTTKKSVSSKGNEPKDKKKLVVACIGCRKKKIKCSSDRPACSNCLRLNILCEYPAIRNRGSRFGYMEMLNKRLNHLEKYINCSTNPDYHPQFVTIHQKPRPSELPDGTKSALNRSNATPESTTLISGEKNGLLNDATGESETSSIISENTPASRIQKADELITQLAPRIPSQIPPPADPARDTSAIDDIELPPLDIILHLVELYFRHVHGQTYSFLHKPTLIPRIFKNQVNKGLVLSLCGLTARYSRHPAVITRVPYLAGEAFISLARRIISNEFDDPTLETVQAMILLIQHDFFRSKGKKSMIYISMAIRMATTLGLHEESPDPKLTFLDREQRRRTYWSLMVLDRLGHSGPHWHVQLRLDIVEIQLPCTDYHFENSIPVVTQKLDGDPPPPIRLSGNAQYPTYPKGKLGLYAYIVKATILWCDINKYVMEGHRKETIPPWEEGSKFHELESRLQSIFSELPKEYQYSRERLIALDTVNQGGALVHLHGELLMSLCYLNRVMYPYNYKKMNFDTKPPETFIERAAINIMASAKAQSSMVDDVLMMEDFNMAPFIGFGVFAVSSVHIANSFSSDPIVASAAKNNLAINLKFLVVMREYWYSVGVWCIILKDRYFQKARRYKLRMQQQNDSKESKKNSTTTDKSNAATNASGTLSNSDNQDGDGSNSKTEGDDNGDDNDNDGKIMNYGFSRPGTPPLAYAPDGLMNLAANKPLHSDNSSSASSPGAHSTYSDSTLGAKSDIEKMIEEASESIKIDDNNLEPASGLADLGLQPYNLVTKGDNTIQDGTESQAQTWSRAVSNTYDDGGNPAKRVKISHPPDEKSFFANTSNSNLEESLLDGVIEPEGYSQPTSPSQFADILSMPTLSQRKVSTPSNKAPPSSSGNSTESREEHGGTTVIGVSSTSRNNLLTDISGEWLNSIDPTDFHQLIDNKGVEDASSIGWVQNNLFENNPSIAGDDSMSSKMNAWMAQQQKQLRIQQLLIQGLQNQLANNNFNNSADMQRQAGNEVRTQSFQHNTTSLFGNSSQQPSTRATDSQSQWVKSPLYQSARFQHPIRAQGVDNAAISSKGEDNGEISPAGTVKPEQSSSFHHIRSGSIGSVQDDDYYSPSSTQQKQLQNLYQRILSRSNSAKNLNQMGLQQISSPPQSSFEPRPEFDGDPSLNDQQIQHLIAAAFSAPPPPSASTNTGSNAATPGLQFQFSPALSAMPPPPMPSFNNNYTQFLNNNLSIGQANLLDEIFQQVMEDNIDPDEGSYLGDDLDSGSSPSLL